MRTCAGCASCVMACKQWNATPHGIYWCTVDIGEVGKYPNAKKRVFPHGCMHCAKGPCVKACPTGASRHTDEGCVVVNQDLCIGCQACVKVCPYGARHFNGEGTTVPYFGVEFDTTSYEDMRTMREHSAGKTGKCDFCTRRLAEGKEPLCVKTCITRSRIFGDLDDPDSAISRAIRETGARSYRPEEGTEPSVYYIGL